MSTISNERLESLQRQFKEEGFNDISDSEIMQLVEENLALRKERERAEPVAWRWRWSDDAEGHWRYTEERRETRGSVTAVPLYTAPPAPVVPDDYFASLVTAARARAEKAMRKFPQPNYVLNKVAEESGEVIKAVIHYAEGRETWQNVETEIIDNLAMLIRLVAEGDGVIGFTPPDACRAAAGISLKIEGE